MKKIKLIGGIFAIVVVAMGILFYVISQKINTDELKKIIEVKIEENLPGTDVRIENLSYRLGTQATLIVSKVELKLLEPFAGQEKLFSVDQLYLNIPFGAILFGGGTIDLEVEQPQFLLSLKGEKNNWDKIIQASSTDDKKEETKDSQSDSKVELPKFISNSKVNLRFFDVNLKLFDNGKQSSFVIEKVLIKNFGLKSKSAFEVASKINYALSDNEVFMSKILLIGQFDTEAFFSDGKLQSSIVMDVKDIVVPNSPMKVPNIHGEVDVEMIKDDIKAEAKMKVGDLLKVDFNVNGDKDIIKMSNLIAEVSVKKLKEGLKDNPALVSLEANNSLMKVTGGLTFNRAKKTIVPKFIFETTEAITLKQNGIAIVNSFKGDYTNTDFRGSLKSELLGGLILTSFNMVLDLNKMEQQPPLSNTIFVNVKGSNARLTRDKVQAILASSASPTAAETAAEVPAEPVEFPELPKINLNLDLAPLFLDEESVALKGKFFTRPKEFGSQGIDLKVGNGSGSLSMSGRVTKTNLSTDLKMNMKNFNLKSINTFLPKIVSGVSGQFNGSFNGKINKGKELSYDLKYNMTAKDGELKNLNLSSFVLPYLDKIPGLKGKVGEKDLNMTDRFELMEAQGSITDKFLDLSRFYFKTAGSSADIKANGKVYMTENGSSRVYAELIDKSGKLNKALNGVKTLPILLEGKGMGITPNFAYTTKKIAGVAAKSAVKKAVEKNKDKIEKKAKKLLKGLFK